MNDQTAPQNQPRRRSVRILKWVLAVVLLLIVLAVVAAALMPWNFLKAPITERVEAATGRELEIRGDVSVRLLPRPHLVLEELAFANADWAQAEEMATIRRLEVTPSLTSLVRGQPVIDDLEITEPTINLQGRGQQPGNWVLPAMASPEDQGEASGEQTDTGTEGDDGPPVVIEQIRVSEVQLRYLAPEAEAPQVLSLSSLEMSENTVRMQGEISLTAGEPSAGLPYEIETTVKPGFSDGHWRLNELDARLGDTRISGSLGLDNGTDRPTVSADLHSPSVNVPEILAKRPESPQESASPGFSVPALPDLAGDIQLAVDELILPAATLGDIEARIRPGKNQLTLETLRFEVTEGEVEAAGRLTSTDESISAEVNGQLKALDLHAFGLGDGPGHLLAAEVALELERLDQAPSLAPETLLEHLDIRVAEGSYRTTEQVQENANELDFTLDQAGDPPAPVLSVSGRYQGKPLALDIEGAPMRNLAKDPADYRLQASARSRQLRAWADTRLGALLSPATFTGNLILEDSDARNLEQWIGPVLPPLPEFRLAGRVSRDQERWSVTGLEGDIGATELTGEVYYHGADRPSINVNLEADRIELAQFLGEASENEAPAGNEPDADTGGNENDGESALSALQAFDGELDLSAGALVLPDETVLKQFQTAATLEAGKLEIQPLRFDVADGTWTSDATLDATSQPASGDIHAEFDAIALSQLGDTFSEVEDRLGKLSGELSLTITETLPANRQDDVLLPFVGRLDIQPSELHFRDDEAGTDMTLALETSGQEAADQRFHIDGEGKYDDTAFSLRFRGDPLLDARDPDRPYGLELRADVVDTRIEVQGTILQPLTLRGLDLGLALDGPSPQRLSRLLGIPLPKLPPYSASGDLSLEDERWIFADITGQAGDSDLGGRVMFDAGKSPPHMEAELSSTALDIEDLGGLVGAEPQEPEDQESRTDSAGDDEVLPDEPLVTPAWQDLSADVRYRAESVRAADIPLSNVEIDFTLEDGHARFEPVRFGVGNGRVDFNLDLDARPQPPEGTLELEMQAVDLRRALRNWPLANDSVGTVAAQGKFWLTGASVADLLASTDGGLVLLMTDGRLDGLLVELAGLDASQSFLSWINARDPIPIDCAYADLQTRDGVADIDTLAIDTADTTFTGVGTVNLATEELDVTINAHPKDVSVFSGRTPFHLGGTFDDIQPGLDEAGLATRLGGSALLAAVAGPVAALVPLLDLGTGENVPYCAGLANRSRDAIDENRDDSEESGNEES